MKDFNEWIRDSKTKTITVTCRDVDDNLEKLLNFIKSVGGSGHSFSIIADEEKFYWDGDGSDRIFEIKVK
jgi:hypothetical protein